jgi:formylglycine-generating enzyme required for sulfatase activity
MVELPGGRFVIGSTREQAEVAGRAWEQYWIGLGSKDLAKQARKWPEDEINSTPLNLPPFAIGRYPVTNGQYRQFIEAGGYDPAAPWWDEAARAWLARDDAATEGLEPWQRRQHKDRPEFWDAEQFGMARPNYPVVGITWYEATAFCRWLTLTLADGYTYRLPSEAEWEYAARGTTRRTYAWGDQESDGERANFDQIFKGTSAVGCFPAGATPDGLLDMSGNVWEWIRSAYRPYPYDPSDGRESGGNPAQKRFTVCGGSWDYPSLYLRAADRNNYTPDRRSVALGFRLARHPSRVKD